MVLGAVILISLFSKNYFTDKLDFTKEKKIDAVANMLPVNASENQQSVLNINNLLAGENTGEYVSLRDSLSKRTTAESKVAYTKIFVADANTRQSKTMKVSVIIFWLILISLAIITFFKNYSMIPLLGVTSCLYLLTGMTLANWLWFGGWLGIGLIVYFLYGYRKSKLAEPTI